MTADTALLDKLSKIKALADEAQNTHECQTALLKYQQLLDKHGLCAADVEITANMQAAKIEETDVYTGQRIAKWIRYLHTVIAKHHRCVAVSNKIYHQTAACKQSLQFIGHKQDTEIAVVAFQTTMHAAAKLYDRYRKIQQNLHPFLCTGICTAVTTGAIICWVLCAAWKLHLSSRKPIPRLTLLYRCLPMYGST